MRKFLAVCFIISGTVTAQAQPEISFPNSPWAFGELLQKEKVFHHFEILNSGSDTLFISRVKPSCGCTSAPLTRDVIGPGESIWLAITFNSKKFSGDISKKVTVFSNDPNNPQSTINFSATVQTNRTRIAVVDEPIDLGSLVPNKRDQSTISLTNIGTEPYRLRLAAWPDGWMETSWKEKVIDPGDTLRLAIGTSSVPPLGKFETSITFEVEGREKTRMSLPLTGVGLVE